MELISLDFRNIIYLIIFLVNGCSGLLPLQANEPLRMNPVKTPTVPINNIGIKVHRNSIVFDFKKDNEANRQQLTSQIKPEALIDTRQSIDPGKKYELVAVLFVDGEVPYNTVNLLLNTLKSNGVRKFSINITTY